ncbi:hypothetical protein [Bradyrhizobium diazoefficiens]|uniref:hypothetical protein n=1 Tax=Bradyrhizobium diazoefficiens TaxID=1355477 RepID=UPI0036F271DD
MSLLFHVALREHRSEEAKKRSGGDEAWHNVPRRPRRSSDAGVAGPIENAGNEPHGATLEIGEAEVCGGTREAGKARGSDIPAR